MKKLVMLWLLAVGVGLWPSVRDAYVWCQMEQQAAIADLVEWSQD